MFVARSHTLFFTINFIITITIILLASGAGLFILSEDANFMILHKTINLFKKHVVPQIPHYGDGVGKLIMTITEKLCIVVFIFSIANLCICVIGLIAVWNQKSTLLNVYQMLIGFQIIGHLALLIGYYYNKQSLKDHLMTFARDYMKEYISLKSGTPGSLFAGSVMALLNCCGADDYHKKWRFPKFDPVDYYDNIIYKGLSLPIPCCRINDNLEIINTTCPFQYTIFNSNIGRDCSKLFAEEISSYTDTFILGSISILVINFETHKTVSWIGRCRVHYLVSYQLSVLSTSVIMLCNAVKAVKDFNPITL
ncbi:tetraspanin-CD63 receptor [Schistosoma japonicum]|nr:tetraspanin-CD63 receptor [Schistosoma japonicum]